MPLKLQCFQALLVLILTMTGVRTAEIQQVQWGFDGKVIPEHFNSLALLVHNPDSKPFEGALVLNEGSLFSQGAPWREMCYLAPGTSRWVYFQPWIGNNTNSFKIRWLPSGKSSDIDEPNIGAPATVILSETGRLGLSKNTFKNFPAELFPSSPLTTDGLACVIIDHVPRWQPAQRQTFRDWLWRGGTVFVLSAIDGSSLRFSQELDFLNRKAITPNQTTSKQVVGAGLVIHYHGDPSDFGPHILLANGFTKPTLQEDNSHSLFLTNNIFQRLTQMVKPHHPWAIIYLTLIVYLLILGPGAWLAARLGIDFRMVNIGISVVIVGCASLMWVVGKRGYGENASLTSLTYAHALGGGDFAATQWSSCFVTNSDNYVLSHPGSNNLFACPNDSEKVEALIFNDGNGAQLRATIPLYSSRSFMHGGRLQIAELEPLIETLSIKNGKVAGLKIHLPGKSVSGKAWVDLCTNAMALYQGNIYALRGSGEFFEQSDSGQPIEKYCNETNHLVSYNSYGYNNSHEQPINSLNQYLPPIIAYSLGGQGVIRKWSKQSQRDDQVILFLLVDHAPTFLTSSGISQQGRAVVRFDLPEPIRKTP